MDCLVRPGKAHCPRCEVSAEHHEAGSCLDGWLHGVLGHSGETPTYSTSIWVAEKLYPMFDRVPPIGLMMRPSGRCMWYSEAHGRVIFGETMELVIARTLLWFLTQKEESEKPLATVLQLPRVPRDVPEVRVASAR